MKQTKHFKRTAFNLSAKSMVSLLLLLIAMLMPQGAWATYFISEIKYAIHDKQETAYGYLSGYEPIKKELNDNPNKSGERWVYIGYKTDTDPSKAITDIMVVSGESYQSGHLETDNGGNSYVTFANDTRKWYRCPSQGQDGSADLNAKNGGDYLALYYTRDGNTTDGKSAITSLDVAYGTGLSGWTYAKLFKNSSITANGNTNEGTNGTPTYITYTTHTHTYTAAFSWATNGKTCTATVSCSCGDTHSNLACTVTDAPKSGGAATCTVMGWTTYTAKVTSNGKDFSATKDVQDIAVLGHSLTATPAKAATCTEAGNNAYWTCSTCKKVFSNSTATTETTVAAQTIAASGHSYGAGSWSWADDGHSAICTRTCGRTGCTTNTTGHTSSKSVTLGNGITSAQQVAPKCSTQGTTRYTATATVENVEYTSTKDVKDIAATGLHAFDDETDPYHTLCTVCDHSFFRYTATAKVEPNSPEQLMNSRNQGIYTTAKHTFADGQGIIEFNEPLVTMGTNAFYLRSALTGNLVIPNSVKSIGQQAFRFCSFSGNLILPNSLTQIGNDAFSQSGFTGDLTIPNSVTSIGEYAFSGCKGFTGDLTIPNSVTSIGDAAFAYCEGLDGNLTIGYSVTSIGLRTFRDCSKLSGVEMKSIPNIHLNAFSNVNCTKAVVLSDDSYVYTGSNSYFPEVSSVTAPCTLDLTGSVVENHANLTRTHECTVKSETETYLASAAGCENDATYFYKCANCDEHGTETWTKAGTAIGHDYSQVVDANYLVSAATCTNDAVYHEKCSRCTTHGAIWSATGTATGNHSYTNNTLTASPVEDGLYAYACDYGCGTHTDDHIIKDFNGEGNHLELTKDGEGNYSTSEDIIINDPASFDSSVDFSSPVDFSAPSVTFNRYIINDGGMWSFIVPFDIPADQAAQLGTFYQYRTHGEGKVYFDNADGIVRANTAYFFKPATDFTSITVDDAEIKATTSMPNAENPSAPGLYGTYSRLWIPAGAYGYMMQHGVSTFVKAGEGNMLRPFRAYLWLGSGASMAKALAFFGDYDDITGINNIETDTDLDMSKPIYTLSGQRIMTPKKGEIYIQNGKKWVTGTGRLDPSLGQRTLSLRPRGINYQDSNTNLILRVRAATVNVPLQPFNL